MVNYNMFINIEKEYPIFIKKYFWVKEILLKPVLLEKYSKNIEPYKKCLNVYDIKVKKIDKFYSFKFYAPKYIENCFINFYFCHLLNNESFSVIEIVDFCVNEKYRSKGIGTKFINVLNKIALKNGVDYIVADLQKDTEDEPLEERKKFYIKNGFILEESPLSKFSGVVAKKKIGDIIQL